MEEIRYDETYVRCEKCGGEWNEPKHLTEQAKTEIAGFARARDPIHAIQSLRLDSEISLRDAKAITIHISRTKDQCEKCGSALTSEGRTSCPKCKSTNYNW
jgi:Zn finger protein HypA/HybF involved in hydrogenase expression